MLITGVICITAFPAKKTMKKKKHFDLGVRERQLVEAVYRLEEASVSEVLDVLEEKPKPAYSTVRTILNTLVRKKVLCSRRDGIRFLYKPRTPQEQTQKTAMNDLVASLFDGSPLAAMVSLLDISGQKLSDDDYDRLSQLIEQARKEGK